MERASSRDSQFGVGFRACSGRAVHAKRRPGTVSLVIPTLMFAGVIAVVVGYKRPVALLAVGVLVSLIWGMGVGDGDIGAIAGDSTLALVNYFIGAVVAAGIRTLFTSFRAEPRPQPDS